MSAKNATTCGLEYLFLKNLVSDVESLLRSKIFLLLFAKPENEVIEFGKL